MKECTMKELRIKRKMTQKYVAEQIGVCKDYVSLIERGKRTPSYKSAEKFAKLYNVSIIQIFSAIQRTITTIQMKGSENNV